MWPGTIGSRRPHFLELVSRGTRLAPSTITVITVTSQDTPIVTFEPDMLSLCPPFLTHMPHCQACSALLGSGLAPSAPPSNRPGCPSTHRLCIHHHGTLLEQLQILAVFDVAKPHADPEVGWGCVLSFTIWVLSQGQINPMGVPWGGATPQGDRDMGEEEGEGRAMSRLAGMGHIHPSGQDLGAGALTSNCVLESESLQ